MSEEKDIILCDYGCGQEANYQFKNGKWCCSDNWKKCPVKRKLISENQLGRKTSEETKNKIGESLKGHIGWNKNKTRSEETKRKISESLKGITPWNKDKKLSKEHRSKISEGGKGRKVSKETRKKISEKMKSRVFSEETKNKMSKSHKGKKLSEETKRKVSENNARGFKGKTHSKKVRMKLRITNMGKLSGNKLTIRKIKEKYPIFAAEEEMRYNPDKPGKKEIQVHCKNHNCNNSKEKGGWFTPKNFYPRIYQLEKEDGNGGSYFYCSDECKQECPLYRLYSDPFKSTELPYTSQEYQMWRTEVFKRQLDEYGYNFCEYCESQENLEAHHIEPVKLQPGLSLDPENGLICCKTCHLNKAHSNECSTGQLSNKHCIG